MATPSQNLNKTAQAKNILNTPLVQITRTFAAPVERVWQAWATPELAKQWWGPEGYSCPEAKIEFREGGRYLMAMKGPDEKVIWSGGVYEQIVPNEKIVCTDSFTDDRGNIVSAESYGMPGNWADVLRVIVEFEEIGDEVTRMSLKHEGIPADMHDDCVQGWSSSFNKLQRLVERT